jgi:dihydrolipoamide dehydrogenase
MARHEELSAKNIIIATGARARDLPFRQGRRQAHLDVSPRDDAARNADKLLVIGSGAIGIEFASFYNDLGAKVTVVEMLDRIVPVEDEEVSAFLNAALKKQGMDIRPSTGVQKITDTGKGISAEIKGADGKVTSEEFSHVIVAVGIVPNTENIGLEALGIATDRGHIVTTAECQTSVAGIYAIGDVYAAALARAQGEP